MPERLVVSGNEESMLPFPRSYWVRPKQLLAGFYPGDKDSDVAKGKLLGLIRCGITTVINLMEEAEVDHSGNGFAQYVGTLEELGRRHGTSITCMRTPIRDLAVPTVAEMVQILDAIDMALARNERVYVHCWGGRGRTGTVIGCYLVRHRLADEGEVLSALAALTEHQRSAFGQIPETPEQRAFVRTWKRGQ